MLEESFDGSVKEEKKECASNDSYEEEKRLQDARDECFNQYSVRDEKKITTSL